MLAATPMILAGVLASYASNCAAALVITDFTLAGVPSGADFKAGAMLTGQWKFDNWSAVDGLYCWAGVLSTQYRDNSTMFVGDAHAPCGQASVNIFIPDRSPSPLLKYDGSEYFVQFVVQVPNPPKVESTAFILRDSKYNEPWDTATKVAAAGVICGVVGPLLGFLASEWLSHHRAARAQAAAQAQAAARAHGAAIGNNVGLGHMPMAVRGAPPGQAAQPLHKAQTVQAVPRGRTG